MGNIYRGVPPNIALRMKNEYNLPIFVETGTFLGRSSYWASAVFDKVYTIESNYAFYLRAVKELRDCTNVRVFHGFSQTSLDIVLNMFPQPALIWLDAHWSKDLQYERFDKVVCPVLDEIEAIARHDRGHAILIDDLRLFGKMNGWPTAKEVRHALEDIGKTVTYETDVFVATPKNGKIIA